jgi:hypothetical protein
MDERKPDFEAVLAEVLEGRASGGSHVTPDLLVAYHHKQLPPDEADRVVEHLAACRPCADLLLELVRFGEDSLEGEKTYAAREGVVDLETEADWRELRSRIASSEGSVAVPKSAAERRPTSRPPYLAYGLAASLLLTVGLGAWVAGLKQELRALREPHVNVAIVNLYTEEFHRGDGNEGSVPREAERFVAILTLPASFRVSAEHRVEILDADGRLIWSGSGLKPTDAGTLHLELTRRLLAPGEYRIRVHVSDKPVEFDLRLDR